MTRFFFLCKKLKWQHSKSYQSDFFGSFNYPRIILRTWKRMNFFLLHQTGSCSENNNISLQGKLQKPPLTLDCYVTSFPQILALSRARRVSMKLLLSKYVYYDAFVPEILTFWIFLDFPQPINPSFFEKKLSPSLQHRYIACILWPGLNTLGSGRCSPCNRIRSETAGRNTLALYCETCKRQTKRYKTDGIIQLRPDKYCGLKNWSHLKILMKLNSCRASTSKTWILDQMCQIHRYSIYCRSKFHISLWLLFLEDFLLVVTHL